MGHNFDSRPTHSDMKKFWIFCALVFDGMFEVPNDPMPVPQGVMGPLNPAVPLDRGLTALLIAGGAAGYRQYKKKKKA